jgi:hypothetical protein
MSLIPTSALGKDFAVFHNMRLVFRKVSLFWKQVLGQKSGQQDIDSLRDIHPHSPQELVTLQ